MVRTRANILAVAPREVLDRFHAICREELQPPIVSACGGSPLPLASANTLLILDVDRLDRSAQSALVAWMGAPENAAVQVVSLTTARLFDLVENGEFDRDLYYHLNTIYLRFDSVDERE